MDSEYIKSLQELKRILVNKDAFETRVLDGNVEVQIDGTDKGLLDLEVSNTFGLKDPTLEGMVVDSKYILKVCNTVCGVFDVPIRYKLEEDNELEKISMVCSENIGYISECTLSITRYK